VKFLKSEYSDEYHCLSFKHRVSTVPFSLGDNSAGWNLSKNKDELNFFFRCSYSETNTFRLNSSTSQNWNILALTDKKLVIETVESARKIKLEFVAI